MTLCWTGKGQVVGVVNVASIVNWLWVGCCDIEAWVRLGLAFTCWLTREGLFVGGVIFASLFQLMLG